MTSLNDKTSLNWNRAKLAADVGLHSLKNSLLFLLEHSFY
jgi:hypothetical protein